MGVTVSQLMDGPRAEPLDVFEEFHHKKGSEADAVLFVAARGLFQLWG
jgi:hypothetical protein